MIDAPTHSLLQDILRRESRSLLQYLDEAFPWATSAHRDELARLKAMVTEERQCSSSLVRMLNRHRLSLPYIGAFPSTFTNVNYLAVDHLIPILVNQQRQAIGDLERDLTCLYDTEAREEVRKIRDLKNRHLHELETMATRTPAAVS